jgi:hypothetical protein
MAHKKRGQFGALEDEVGNSCSTVGTRRVALVNIISIGSNSFKEYLWKIVYLIK